VKTNLSNRITSEDCKGCGKCCEVFEVWYDDACRPTLKSEIQRFQLLQGIGDLITTRPAPDGVWLVFNSPCRHLNPDKSCAIHESPDRPMLCRQFPYPASSKEDCPKVRP
jgi:Fe-S-cluster containining protein